MCPRISFFGIVIAVVCASHVRAQSPVPTAVHAPQPIEAVGTLVDSYFDQGTITQAQAIVDVLEPVAASLPGADGSDLGTRFVAHKRYREGDIIQALTLFEQVIANPESVEDLTDALRMKAQIQAITEQPELALDTYALLVAVIDQSDTKHVFPSTYVNAIGWLASLESANGNHAASVLLLEQITDDPNLIMTHRERVEYLHQLANHNGAAGDLDGAATAYARLETELSQYPANPGFTVWLLLEKATLFDIDRGTDDFRLQLADLILDDMIANDPAALVAAIEFLSSVGSLQPHDQYAWVDVLLAIEGIGLDHAQDTETGIDPLAVRANAAFLVGESARSVDDIPTALDAYQRVIALQPEEPIGGAAQQGVAMIEDDLGGDPCDDSGDPTSPGG